MLDTRLIWVNTVYHRIFSFVWLGLTKVSQAAAGRNIWIDPSKYPRKYSKYHVSGLQTRDIQGYQLYLLDSNFNEDHYFSFMFKKGVHNAIGGKLKYFFITSNLFQHVNLVFVARENQTRNPIVWGQCFFPLQCIAIKMHLPANYISYPRSPI